MFTVNLSKEKQIPKEGIYKSKIIRAYEYVSKYGEPLVSVQFKVFDKEDNYLCFVWKNIVFSLQGEKNLEKKEFLDQRASQFLRLIGFKSTGKIKIDPQEWIGKEIGLYLSKDTYRDEVRPYVKYFCEIDRIGETEILSKIQEMEEVKI